MFLRFEISFVLNLKLKYCLSSLTVDSLIAELSADHSVSNDASKPTQPTVATNASHGHRGGAQFDSIRRSQDCQPLRRKYKIAHIFANSSRKTDTENEDPLRMVS